MKIVFLSGLFCLGLGISIPSYAASNKPAKAVIKSIKTVSAKKIVVKAKKQNNIKGYQVRYSRNKNMTDAKMKTFKKTSVALKNLNKETCYYIQVRAFRMKKGTRIYGKWSKKKNAVTLKKNGKIHKHAIKQVVQEELGHYETKIVKEAWIEEVKDWRTICGVCKMDLTKLTDDELTIHVVVECGGGYYTDYVTVDIIEHPAVMEKVWVIDQKAKTFYECKCGKKQTESQHAHKWEKVVKKVTHPEEGHYKTTIIEETWTEDVKAWRTFCNKCGEDLSDLKADEIAFHSAVLCESGYHADYVVVDTIEHPAITEKVWVVDKEAWTEKVITGYKCDCGATK